MIGVFFYVATLLSAYQKKTELVNPFIGTGGHGHTYPGATLPFGMVQLSPDTRLSTWDGCSGYHYSDSSIIGFSHTHLSGTGILDYGDILIMPIVGDVMLDPGTPDKPDSGYRSRFSHKNEKARPGYYKVFLDDYKVGVELTATYRVGFHKYVFPNSKKSHILLDLKHRDKVLESMLKVVSDTEVVGYRISRSWADSQFVFFAAVFSKPIKNYTIFIDNKAIDGNSAEGTNIKLVIDYKTKKNEPVYVKVAISPVSIEGARLNLANELPGWDFNGTVKKADDIWEKELNKIEVFGKDKNDLINFYTALYHALIVPNIYTDVDGSYRGMDFQIHKAIGFDYYTVFSLWDTFRATHPLYTIIDRKRTVDFIKTFLIHYKQGGKLPVWELSSNESNVMIGYHSIPVIADAYMKGIRDFDIFTAFEAMKHSANLDEFGLKYYKKYGYIPSSKEGAGVSKTLEYAYDDWCIAEIAKTIGKEEDYKTFIKRAQYYKNLFDSETGFFRPKFNGRFKEPFDPKEVSFSYTEANAWQYNFFVPHDVSGHIKLYGSVEKYEKKLDQLFSESSDLKGIDQPDISGLIGQYAHGNEPSHHIIYLYNYVGSPWKTAERARFVMKNFYKNSPDGLIGNEDCGQMSSWFVLSSMGFYPVCPGKTTYEVGSPLFDSVFIHLENGKTCKLIYHNNNDNNIYVDKMKIDGKDYLKSYIDHFDLIDGKRIEFFMSNNPSKSWGIKNGDIPVSEITSNFITINPYVKKGARSFSDYTEVELATIEEGSKIYYSLGNELPTLKSKVYKKPFKVNKSTIVKFFAYKNGKKSHIDEADFFVVPVDWTIKLEHPYSQQYPAGGPNSLIDGIRGANNFRTGDWQGYHGVDLSAIVDMHKEKEVSEIRIGFIQDMRSWIFMPEYVEFYISVDGKNFEKVGEMKNDIPEREAASIVKDFYVKFRPQKARYIKVFAKNRGVCPPWHLGAGGTAWLFADEIIVK